MVIAAPPSDPWPFFVYHLKRLAPYLSLWLLALVAVAKLFDEPAAVQLFLALSVGALIARNFAPRAAGSMSAYAAFNRGGVALLGDLRAGQIDNELRRRPAEWGGSDEGSADEGGGRPLENGGARGRRNESAWEEKVTPEVEAARRHVFIEARRNRLAAAAAARRG